MSSTTPAIVWEDPPSSKSGDRRTTFWRAVAVELRNAPEKWAKVQVYPTRAAAASKVTRINSGRMIGLGEGQWEAKHRGSDEDGWSLYLRYLGGPDDEGAEPEPAKTPTASPFMQKS